MLSDAAFDVVIVGGGTSGCVMAARLSENPRCRVLLIEAGPDYPEPQDWPAPLLDANEPVLSGFNWKIDAHIRSVGDLRDLHRLQGIARAARVFAASPRDAWSAAKAVVHAPQSVANTLHTFPYVPGKVIGGSSAVNGAVALRPSPSDFDVWAQVAGDTWSWQSVLPSFRNIESDEDFISAAHGQTGPMRIARPTLATLSDGQRSFFDACLAQGMVQVDDLNESVEEGVGMLPSSATAGRRVSTATAYLQPARARPNLKIVAQSLVRRVVFDGLRVSGIEMAHGDESTFVAARHVVLCAGAIQTPAVLMRSGIGDAGLCQALGVTPVQHLPGVGEQLADHPSVMLWMVPRPGVSVSTAKFPQHQVMARVASQTGGAADVNLFFLAGFSTASIPMLAGMLKSPVAHALSVVLAKPRSRGRVAVTHADPMTLPRVELNLGADAADIERLMLGVRAAWRLANTERIQAVAQSVFIWNETIVRSDKLLRSAIERMIGGTWHAVGTARMGLEHDPNAVVDAQCRVHGVQGLHVADASVMPAIPSSPTHLTCIMIAERASAWVAAEAVATT